jgi:uncharacterized protein DUF4331
MRKLRLLVPVALLVGVASLVVHGSDHDDGETPTKGRSVNLTDLYVFREGDQSGNTADNANLVFMLSANPRSLARQQYYWGTNARYEFHVSRRATAAEAADGAEDVILRFEFGAPDATNRQQIMVTAIRGAEVLTTGVRSDNGTPIFTTPLGSAATPTNNPVALGGANLLVHAGHHADTFFFDVEQFFRVRAGLGGFGPPTAGFRPAASAVDFAAGYNTNSIVVRVPISFLQNGTTATIFDVWETISVRN